MRALYILCRIITDLGTLFSCTINAVFFCGSTAQTLSARAFIEGMESERWRRIGTAINWLFFWQADHIRTSWENEVDRARYVLDRLEGLK